MSQEMNRRQFGLSAATLCASASVFAAGLPGANAANAREETPAQKLKLKKAVKFGMIGGKGSVEEKFNLIKKLGFQGVEMDSPSGVSVEEAVAAKDKTGIVIHGVVDSVHWKDTLSHPDEAVRKKGLDALLGAIKDCKAYGGTTVLLVPGVVNKDATYEQCFERSAAEVKKAIPLAKESGVKIAMETVWNNFITKPEQMVAYVDQFQDDTVGAYFDISNMIKYGVTPAQWIRILGKRLLKFDFKGYSKAKTWCEIGQGDEDWPEVLKALVEVGYKGEFATSEVGGGGEERLKTIAQQMNKVLGL